MTEFAQSRALRNLKRSLAHWLKLARQTRQLQSGLYRAAAYHRRMRSAAIVREWQRWASDTASFRAREKAAHSLHARAFAQQTFALWLGRMRRKRAGRTVAERRARNMRSLGFTFWQYATKCA